MKKSYEITAVYQGKGKQLYRVIEPAWKALEIMDSTDCGSECFDVCSGSTVLESGVKKLSAKGLVEDWLTSVR